MIKICLATNLRGDRAYSLIEDEEGNSVYLCDPDMEDGEPENLTPAAACEQAALVLRQAAKRFELLAKESTPFKEKTQDKINSMPTSI